MASTCRQYVFVMERTPMPQKDRKILGISMSPTMAGDIKAEAARRNISLRKLFEELWSMYLERRAK